MSFMMPPPPSARPQDDAHSNNNSNSNSNIATRTSSHRIARSTTLDGATPAADRINRDGSAEPTAQLVTPRRNIVFPDPVAFRYLEDDPCVTVVERRSVLRGYELYLVEQWACARGSPNLVIVTYTGDETHSIVVGVLAVPADQRLWTKKLRVYFKATGQHMGRPKETELGELLVTNLSSFPSALTVISVPSGDIRKHRPTFFVNEDLKRLGCSGRSGMTLTEPTEATQAKFQQLYKTSEKIPFPQAVMELVKLCQFALYMFEKLEHEYIDGLLCDKTETAIGNWWTEVGAEHYNFDPTDGILGPSTVAALLGMLLGARNRLHWFGAPVSKDVFDIEYTKRGIAYFQKSTKLEKTRRLDRQTLLKLYSMSAKAAVGEGWGVQKAVKSTMTEFGGRRGELVIGMVAGKDKGGLADVETLDLDKFISLVYGDRPKWLWFGKGRRPYPDSMERDAEAVDVPQDKDEQFEQAARRTRSMPVTEELESRKKEQETRQKEQSPPVYGDAPLGSTLSLTDSPGDKEALRKAVFKSMAGKVSDARSGFGRIKDVVGGSRRGHGSRPSISAREDFGENGSVTPSILSPANNTAIDSSPAVVNRAFSWKNKPDEYLTGLRRVESEQPPSHPSRLGEETPPTELASARKIEELKRDLNQIGDEVRKDILPTVPNEPDAAGEADLQGRYLDAERRADSKQLELSRRHSHDYSELSRPRVPNEARWPRRLSFGEAEEAILTWEEIVDIGNDASDLQEVDALFEVARHLYQTIDNIVYDVEPWVEDKLKAVELLDERYSRDKDDLLNLYHQLSEACQRVRFSSEELLSEERANLTESVKEIEAAISRLEYEISALVQKVRDVEDGIVNFERQVEDVEGRAEVLKVQLETESWLHWFVRTMTGVGMGPHITREREQRTS